MKSWIVIVAAIMLSGCAFDGDFREDLAYQPPQPIRNTTFSAQLLPEPNGPPITVAVYGFQDKTGQKKPSDRLASFSTAVTQGSEVFLIKALQDAGRWFTVVERVGLDNLIKERQLIRNQREVYEGKDAKPLRPMVVAGLMIEGGIIGYDANTKSGGHGARILGIGANKQYRVDEILVAIRVISVNTGEVLLSNSVSKTVYSTAFNSGVMRFIADGTRAIELEAGVAVNEPTTYAIRLAVEQVVYNMIFDGEKKGLWSFKQGDSK